jgi:hypothetical protein
MRVLIVVLGIIIFLIPGTGAVDPDYLIVTTDVPWVVAGGTDTASVSVTVMNSSIGPISAVPVRIWCEDPTMGTITVDRGLTNANGLVVGTFTSGTRSGVATIIAEVVGIPLRNSTHQRVDHAEPKRWSYLSYPAKLPVNSAATLQIQMKDAYDNVVDDRRIAETVTLLSAGEEGSGFWTGSEYLPRITAPVGADGNVTVQYKVPPIAQNTIIQVSAPPTVISNIQWIVLTSVAVHPSTLYSYLTPENGQVKANDEDTFTLIYTLKDEWGNPVPNAAVWRNTTLGEHDRFLTNDEGIVITRYGPKNSVGEVTITATVEGYPDVTVSNPVAFIPTDPVMWELTANPDTVASREVDEDALTYIRAIVMDRQGDMVEDEPVLFEIVQTTGSVPLTREPELTAGTAWTDADGFATVGLRPGAFPSATDPSYNPSSLGTAIVQATWRGNVKQIPVYFKNYPYLRVQTYVYPTTVRVNQTVDVTVRLIGDGWAYQQKPLDVILCTDRSGSMLRNKSESIEDRMVHAMGAAKVFVGELSPQDRIGLVSFGDNAGTHGWANLTGGRDQYYSHYWAGVDGSHSDDDRYIASHYPGNPHRYNSLATIDSTLMFDKTAACNTIDQMVPCGGTPMREGLYRSVRLFLTDPTPRPNAIKAIVLLTDGAWNTGGDPRGERGAASWPDDNIEARDSIATWAKENGIRIYTIGLGNEPYHDQLQEYAEETGGKYYFAPTADQLAAIYTKIVGDLKVIAAAKPQVNLSFQRLNVSYNNQTSSTPGGEVFDYIRENGYSTLISSWEATSSGWQLLYHYEQDDTQNWSARELYFDAGDIRIGQIWQVSFRFIAKTPGSINIFGPESAIRLSGEGGNQIQPLPDTFITALANLTLQTEDQVRVDVKDLRVVGELIGDGATDLLPIGWTLNYTGEFPVKQDVYTQFSGDNIVWSNDWVLIHSSATGGGPIDDAPFMAWSDVRERSGYYMFRVVAREDRPGGVSDEEILPPFYLEIGNSFIVIR